VPGKPRGLDVQTVVARQQGMHTVGRNLKIMIYGELCTPSVTMLTGLRSEAEKERKAMNALSFLFAISPRIPSLEGLA